MFHDYQRVACANQPFQGGKQRFHIFRMQPGGRLIQHVEHAKQARNHLGCQTDALQLAGGE